MYVFLPQSLGGSPRCHNLRAPRPRPALKNSYSLPVGSPKLDGSFKEADGPRLPPSEPHIHSGRAPHMTRLQTAVGTRVPRRTFKRFPRFQTQIRNKLSEESVQGWGAAPQRTSGRAGFTSVGGGDLGSRSPTLPPTSVHHTPQLPTRPKLSLRGRRPRTRGRQGVRVSPSGRGAAARPSLFRGLSLPNLYPRTPA